MKNKVPQSISGERAKQIGEWAIAQKIKYAEQFVNTEHYAVLETVRRPIVLASGSSGRYIYHAVTENFLHCEIVSEKMLQANQTVRILITQVLEERIKKGGDIEVSAKFI